MDREQLNQWVEEQMDREEGQKDGWTGREVCLGEWKDTWTDRVNGWLNRLMNGEQGSGYLMGR